MKIKDMKKIFFIAAAASLTLGVTSCGEDFLTEEPSSKLPLDGYYNSESRILESAVAAYDPMHWFDYSDGWAPLNLVWDSMGDDVYVGGGNTGDQGQIHKISQYKSDPNDNIGGAWITAYSGINRSIRLIDNATALESMDDAKRQMFIDEGRTLRAWYYLVLWKTWGNVPFYMENLTFPYIAEQISADELYANIIVDLEDVLAGNGLPMKRPDAEAGRMTWAAAAMIYADYVMYQKDQTRYGKALDYMKKIITSNQYDLVAGADYDQLFDYEHEWSKEIILDINFKSKGGARAWDKAKAPGGTVLPAMIGIDGLTYYGGEDKQVDFEGGWGFLAISKEVYDAFEENDLRRDISLLNIETYMEDMMKNKNTLVTYGGRYQNTGVFLRKYLGRPGGKEGVVGSGDLNWENNLHLYRYAETLLNAAELALATGDNGAQGYFNQVRDRAGLPQKTVSVDNILAERRVEFVGEGKRYFDLVRSGKAASVLTKGSGKLPEKTRKLVWLKDEDYAKGKNTDYKEYILVPKSDLKMLSEKDFKDGEKPRNLYWTCAATVWSAPGKAVPEREAWNEKKKYIQIPQSEIEAAKGTITQNEY